MDPSLLRPKDPLIGARLDGRYLVTGTLGRGGMGVVYEGVHEQLGRKVAIKVLSAAIATEPVVVQRFLREARIAAGLGHGNIVDVSDLGHLPDGRPYLVMPKIEGTAFSDLLVRKGPMSPGRVVELLRGVASALDLVHAKGLVHRDVKPENLMHVVREDGSETVMLMDFGIAVLLTKDAARLTGEGVVCGTPAYLAPESARGEDADHRADVYALATVAFELMTGTVPFDAENPMKILPLKAFRDPPRLSEVARRPFPEQVETVIARGLARVPEERYMTAGAFVRALELAVDPKAALRPSAPPTELHASPLPPKPRMPTESAELPLGSSDMIELSAAAPDDGTLSEIERMPTQRTPASSSPPPPLPRRRLAPIAVLSAGALALGSAAVAMWQGASPSPRELRVVPEAPKARVPESPVQPAPAAPAPAAAPEPSGALDPAPGALEAPGPDEPPPLEPAASDERAGALEPQPAQEAPERPRRASSSRARSTSGSASRTRTAAPAPPSPAPSLAVTPAPTPAPPPKPAEPAGPSSAELARQANSAMMQGHLARAAELFEQAAARDPRNVAAWRGLGLVTERLGRRDDAMRAYRRALQLAPSGRQAEAVRGRLQALENAKP